MKKIKLIGLLVLVMSLNSCTLDCCLNTTYHKLEPLFFVFQDIAGNDLLKELGLEFHERGTYSISRQTATLHVKYPDGRMEVSRNPSIEVFNSSWVSAWSIETYGFYVLRVVLPRTNIWAYYRNALPPAEWITYRLQFPALFGSDTVYEVVTYWRVIYNNWVHPAPARSYCYRIVFNGQEIIPTRHYISRSPELIEKWPDAGTHGAYYSIVRIVLDRD